ncbi:cyclic nucleotide-gated ion channel 1 isoform X2 [Prunus yedoensis var. nudiflora]|uniref:Cyclic nucleotide-gated ion channel 1 isoform X2 n=1 Tax=Prunus yedoensis var. nudiflora TaxID=2094558 RepID=A0A314XJD0_PRUYE|nr:cyclic nucleotide-gated ion channel 1 isoform X2 [Prunus yedoensis var. nudiflora]
MIVISCIIAIALDPLFLYIPFIDEEKKCLGMDKNLRNAALILRSLMDITFLVHIGYQIYEGIKEAYKEINKTKVQWELDLQMTLIRRDEIIPFAVTFAGKLSWGSLLIDLLSVFPMPQILVIKVFFKMRRRAYNIGRMVLNFFLLSQYVLRIGRIIFSSKQLTWTIGVRVKALINLFLYILASHAFIQMETTKSEKLREHIDMDKEAQKIKLKQRKIEKWMEKVGIPDDLKKEIININPNLEEDKDADLENLFNCVPWYMKKSLKQLLGLNILSQVELLKETKDEVLKAMCDDLTPVTYAKDKIIIREGDRIDRMLLIIDGTVSFGPDSGATKQLEKGFLPAPEM